MANQIAIAIFSISDDAPFILEMTDRTVSNSTNYFSHESVKNKLKKSKMLEKGWEIKKGWNCEEKCTLNEQDDNFEKKIKISQIIKENIKRI